MMLQVPHDVTSSTEMGLAQEQVLTLTICKQLNETYYPIEISNVMPVSSDTDTTLTKNFNHNIKIHKTCSNSMINNTEFTR